MHPALNAADRNYAQLEKDMLRTVYGLRKFNEYVYGKTVSVEQTTNLWTALFKNKHI